MKAFYLQDEMPQGELREWESGVILPQDFAGKCRVYFIDGSRADFNTYVENGERCWDCVKVIGQ